MSGGGRNSSALELREQILRGIVGETAVAGKELLIEDWRSQEAGELLLLDGIARQGKHMAQAGIDEASNAAFERLEESELAIC